MYRSSPTWALKQPPPPHARKPAPSVQNAHKHQISIEEYVLKNAGEQGVGRNNNNKNNNNNNNNNNYYYYYDDDDDYYYYYNTVTLLLAAQSFHTIQFVGWCVLVFPPVPRTRMHIYNANIRKIRQPAKGVRAPIRHLPVEVDQVVVDKE